MEVIKILEDEYILYTEVNMTDDTILAKFKNAIRL